MVEPAPPAFVLDASLLRQYYDSFDDLLDDIQTSSLAQGFALSIRRSLRFVNGKYTRYDLACVCWGSPPAAKSTQKRAQHASLRCGCGFNARALFCRETSLWELIIIDSNHNHAPHDLPHEISTHRRRLRRANARFELHLERLSRLGTKSASEIANELQAILTNDEGRPVRVTQQDIINAQQDLIRRKYGPLSSTQIFLCILESTPEIYYRLRRAQDGRINAVFFTFEWAIGQWKENHEVVSFDCTYKVNRFDMPLLQVTGITKLHTTFTIAFCLVSGEKKDDFLWPLEKLEELCQARRILIPRVILSDMDIAFKKAASQVFDSQQQLCLWHIGKNVVYNIHRKWKNPNNNESQPPMETQDGNDFATEFEGEIDEFCVPLSATATINTTTPAGCIQAYRACVYAPDKLEFDHAWQEFQRVFANQLGLFYLKKI